jgi:hypothetical protein
LPGYSNLPLSAVTCHHKSNLPLSALSFMTVIIMAMVIIIIAVIIIMNAMIRVCATLQDVLLTAFRFLQSYSVCKTLIIATLFPDILKAIIIIYWD